MADENSAIESGSEETGQDGPRADAIEQGTYEIIRDRLKQQARELQQRTQRLNDRRLEIFGGTELAVVGNERIRTENNCVPRDIARVGDRLLFGYNVFIGLKRETAVSDVFSCHRFIETEANEGPELSFTFEPAQADFLEDPQFSQDFRELYQYYKSTRLLQLRTLDAKVLAVFQIGGTVHDSKVLRWAVDTSGEATYIDNRGERDHVFAPAYDFDWMPTTREDHVAGRHPHVDILDEVFVETVGGDLTVKIENNTEDGLGIYREPVDDPDQSLDDAEIHYAKLGALILLKILPYREEQWRYLVFNTRTRSVERIDAIGTACQRAPRGSRNHLPRRLLPADRTEADLRKRGRPARVRSPHPLAQRRGRALRLPRPWTGPHAAAALQPDPQRGRCRHPLPRLQRSSDDGRMVIFRATSDEPTRVHAMQIWQTPFQTAEFAASQTSESAGSYLERIGNADLVRGISDAFSLTRSIDEQEPSIPIYEAT